MKMKMKMKKMKKMKMKKKKKKKLFLRSYCLVKSVERKNYGIPRLATAHKGTSYNILFSKTNKVSLLSLKNQNS